MTYRTYIIVQMVLTFILINQTFAQNNCSSLLINKQSKTDEQSKTNKQSKTDEQSKTNKQNKTNEQSKTDEQSKTNKQNKTNEQNKTNKLDKQKKAVPGFMYNNVWSKSSKKNFNKADVNGILIQLTSKYFLKNKTLPNVDELETALLQFVGERKKTRALKIIREKGLEHHFSIKNNPSSVENIMIVSIHARHNGFFHSYKKKIRQVTADFFTSRYRLPSLQELTDALGVPLGVTLAFIGDQENFFKRVMANDVSSDQIKKMKSTLVKLFVRTVRQSDVQEFKRTQPTTPNLERLYQTLMAMAEKFNGGLPAALKSDLLNVDFVQEDLRIILGVNMPSDGVNMPSDSFSLFSGISSLEATARIQSPSAFKNYVPSEILESEKFTNLEQALRNKEGFLITSVNAGIPINEKMWLTMQKAAEDKNYDIIVYPTGGVLDGLDQRLLSSPRVHIITHTYENEFLKLWDAGALAKNQNSLAGFSNKRQHRPMQLVITGHPQIAMQTVPTGTNHIRSTFIWSTGSLSLPLYPFQHAAQKRTSSMAKNNHDMGFIMLEKADGESGPSGEGIPNYWHLRQVHFIEGYRGESGFSDNMTRYFIPESSKTESSKTESSKTESSKTESSKKQGEELSLKSVLVEKTEAEALVLGDLHERLSDPVFIKTAMDFIDENNVKQLILHDPIDGGSHNHHEAKNIRGLIDKFLKGELDYHAEMMGLVGFVNAVTTNFPEIKVVIVDSNHSYWGKALVNQASELQEVVNGRFLTELRNAKQVYDVTDPIRYVFTYRNDYIERLPEPAKSEFLSTAILVAHPDRISVQGFGRNFVVGPQDRPVFLGFHGHQGSNGARGSARTHSIGSPSAVTGDSHQTMISGLWSSVGTSTPPKVGYNDGGYSAWTNSMAIVYKDGSVQTFIYSSETQTLLKRQGKESMTPDEFFGGQNITRILDDNEVAGPGVFIPDQISPVVGKLSKSGRVDR